MLTLVRYLHVVSMAGWLGAALWLAGDARRSLDAGPEATQAFLRRSLASLRFDRWAGMATLVTGATLIYLTRVWPALPAPLLVGMTLGIARAALTDAALLPAVRKLAVQLEAGAAPAALLPAAGRLAMLSGIGHLVWLGALAGMIAAT
jgi:hypothetical protein